MMFYTNHIQFIQTLIIYCYGFLIFDMEKFEKDLPLSQNKEGIVR